LGPAHLCRPWEQRHLPPPENHIRRQEIDRVTGNISLIIEEMISASYVMPITADRWVPCTRNWTIASRTIPLARQ